MFIVAELNDIIKSSENINIYNDGKLTVYSKGEARYCQMIEEWYILTGNSYEMPAFGVSLNTETIEAMGSGLWVEFTFNKQYTHNEMPFEKLLVKVERLSQGFNIFRYNSECGYNGRCYYVSLVDKDMSDFYDVLVDF